MTERQFIVKLRRVLQRDQVWKDGKASDQLLALSKLGVKTYPRSASVLCTHGDILSLAFNTPGVTRRQAIVYYKKAVRMDPECVDAWEGIGASYDILEKLDAAEIAFRRALACGGSPYSFAGLAQVLEEQGRRSEALKLLSKRRCPFHDHPVVKRERAEIKAGVWEPDDVGRQNRRKGSKERKASRKPRTRTRMRSTGSSTAATRRTV